ncbi:MAG TPA: histidine--tRNA ligase [Thermoanaerobaculia bacterium]|nr:histidine--tRNA ligase [Thermoanaerobaculia bacterium]
MSTMSDPERHSAVEPRLPRGFRDLLPELMMARNWIIDTVRRVYESYGFVPLQTPAIEHLDVLFDSAGEEAQHQTFTAHNPDKEPLGLRFDLTVPLARVVAQYPELPRPFRRYQVAPVWRFDKPAKGRYREFTQFDIDSVGVDSEVADAEIIACICDALKALGLGRYLVRFSSRALLNLLLDFAAIPQERGVEVFRVLDKLDKIGIENVLKELTTGHVFSGDTIKGLGLRQSQVERIEQFVAIRANRRDDVILQLRQLFAHVHGATEEIDVVENISTVLRKMRKGDDEVAIDLSIARGLAYYTGPVFEAILLDAPQFGSIFGGGRYDNLVTRFLGERIPATGASLGVDRLLDAMEYLNRVSSRRATARVLVANMDHALTLDYVGFARELRAAGIPTELYLGSERSVGRQLKYADQCGLPLVVLFGSNEKESGTVTIKDMSVGRKSAKQTAERVEWLAARSGQHVIPRDQLVPAIGRLLAAIDGSDPARGC